MKHFETKRNIQLAFVILLAFMLLIFVITVARNRLGYNTYTPKSQTPAILNNPEASTKNEFDVSPTPSPPTFNYHKTDASVVSACDLQLSLPSGYTLEKVNAENSFFGITDHEALDSQSGRMCYVVYGPNYQNQYEGFVGEQIQVNAYTTNLTSPDKLYYLSTNKVGIPRDALDEEGRVRYARLGYGGIDTVLTFQLNDIIYEIVWRSSENIDALIYSLASQIKAEKTL